MSEGTERTRGDAGDAEHAVPGHGHQCLLDHGRQRPDRRPRGRSPLHDDRARRARISEGADAERRPRVERRERTRVQYLRAVVRELRCLTRIELRHDAGARNESRIGGEESGNVLPERDLGGTEHSRQHRRREVGAAAAEGHDGAVATGADESRHEDRLAPLEQRQDDRPRGCLRPGKIGRRVAKAAVRLNDFGRVEGSG